MNGWRNFKECCGKGGADTTKITGWIVARSLVEGKGFGRGRQKISAEEAGRNIGDDPSPRPQPQGIGEQVKNQRGAEQ